jgi:hypothetical protein
VERTHREGRRKKRSKKIAEKKREKEDNVSNKYHRNTNHKEIDREREKRTKVSSSVPPQMSQIHQEAL